MITLQDVQSLWGKTERLLDALNEEVKEHYSDADNRQSPTYICRNCGYMGRIINNTIKHVCATEL